MAKTNEKDVHIDQQLIQNTIDYLSERPFKDVANLISAWAKCFKIKEPVKVPEPKPEDVE